VRPDKDGVPHKLDLQLYQRSADLFLGVPFNIASYAALVHLVAAQTDLVPGDFVHTFGDAHIYLNHQDQVREQLGRDARPFPRLVLAPRDSVFEHTLDDFEIVGYNPHSRISAPVSV
jgi:thymidylate synthase